MVLEQEASSAQIQPILQSKAFRTSEVHRNLPSYLAEKSLSGDAENLKEYTVGLLGLIFADSRLICSAALAHHSIDAVYDRSKPTEYTAKIIGMQWVNPHCAFTAEVSSPDGSTAVSAFELGSVIGLLNSGWTKDALKSGEIVTVTALPPKADTHRSTATCWRTRIHGGICALPKTSSSAVLKSCFPWY